MRIRVTVLTLLGLASLIALAQPPGRIEGTIDQLIARAESAPLGERPGLYLQIAKRQAESADRSYEAGNSEAGNAATNDVVTYSGKASDAAVQSGKKLKDTEIAIRKMAKQFRDIKHNLPFDDQAPVQQAIDRLEKMRTDLLSAMFGKKDRKEK
jgi:hypothetical protein